MRASLLFVLLTACGTTPDAPDASEPMDAAAIDAGATVDAGTRADAGAEPDAGQGEDAGATVDAGARVDGGATVDAGTSECSPTQPCTDGRICTGQPSCGSDWICVDSGTACTDDAVPYCGCDGVTFTDSGNCPTRPYAHRGTCEGGVDCDRRSVTCRAPEPVCPAGEVAEVEGSCWSFRCVPIDSCRCAGPEQCPMPDMYTCHMFRMRCGPYL